MATHLRKAAWLTAVFALLAPGLAAAQLGPFEDVQLHGFVSQGFLKSTANNYLGYSHRGTLDFTEGAVNVNSQLGETLSAGLQLFVAKVGTTGDFDARFDWFNLDWHRFGWLNARAGRIKLPFGLQNEQSDYDPGRLTVLLPQSIYPLTSRDFLLAATGGELYGFLPLHSWGSLSYAVVGGTSFLDVSTSAPPGSTVDVPYTVCGRVLWDLPLTGLRLGGSVLATQLDFSTNLNGASLTGALPALLWVASAEYQRGALKLLAEYSRWKVRFESDAPAVFPSLTQVSERAYVQGEYRLNGPVSLGLYYALLFPDVDKRSGSPDRYAHDVAASLRYDFNAHFLFKLEAHLEHGTAGLSSPLNRGLPLADLTEDWGLLTGKVTAYF